MLCILLLLHVLHTVQYMYLSGTHYACMCVCVLCVWQNTVHRIYTLAHSHTAPVLTKRNGIFTNTHTLTSHITHIHTYTHSHTFTLPTFSFLLNPPPPPPRGKLRDLLSCDGCTLCTSDGALCACASACAVVWWSAKSADSGTCSSPSGRAGALAGLCVCVCVRVPLL